MQMGAKGHLATAAVLVFHCGLVGYSAVLHSPSWDEPKHVLAGISHWKFGTFDLYRVNPPLVRMVAVVPLLFVDYQTNWSQYNAADGAQSELAIRKDFIAANGQRTFWLHTLARWGCIPFSLLGGYLCFCWANELYGRHAGPLALMLWCFSPNVVAHGSQVTADVGATAMGVAAAYAYWRWLRQPTWGRAVVAGIGLGLAELTKTTWVVLYGLWPLLWIAWLLARRSELKTETGELDSSEDNASSIPVRRELGKLALILAMGLYLTNLGYGFEGSFQRLGDYGFVSKVFGGPRQDVGSGIEVRNRFQESWLANVPVPLPKNYVMGIDLQRWDFERTMWSYLRGEWRAGGWWYYYLYALAIKVPLGTWILALLSMLVGLFGRGYAVGRWDELVLLAPPIVILMLVSSQTGFNHHLRYVLPIFPFVFIWASKVARAFEFGHRKLAAVVVVAITWSVGSSLWVYPHSLSYFNELVGGPKNGHAHLLNSNIDWGQDLLYLKRWLDNHPEAKPLHLAYSNCYDASVAGIEHTWPPTEPQPGWHVLSVNEIRSPTREYEYFLRFKPVGSAGYSIYIYHITLDEANRVRRELGLSEITAKEATTMSLEPESGRDGG